MSITEETRKESLKIIKPAISKRHKEILDILAHKNMTAMEVALELFRRKKTARIDRNYAHPRLTELEKAEKIKAIGKRKCTVTGRTVAIYAKVNETNETGNEEKV